MLHDCFHGQLGKYSVRHCRAPHAGVRPQYSRSWPDFLETSCETPLPGAIQPSARQLTPCLGGYSFETIPGTLSATAYLVLYPYSVVTFGTGPPYPQPEDAPGGLFQGPLIGFRRNQSRTGLITIITIMCTIIIQRNFGNI